jgi:hypothetical protein
MAGLNFNSGGNLSASERYRQLLAQGIPNLNTNPGAYLASSDARGDYFRELQGLKELAQMETMMGAFGAGGSVGGASGSSGGGVAPAGPNPYEQRLLSLLDNPNKIADTGAYKFRMQEGQRALERSAAAKGMSGSGNTLAALTQYGQGQAAQAYGDEANRLSDLVGKRYGYEASLADTAAKRYAADRSTASDLAKTQMQIWSARNPVQMGTPGGFITRWV